MQTKRHPKQVDLKDFGGGTFFQLSRHFSAIWMFPKIVGFSTQIIHFKRVFHYKPWGHPPIFGNTHIKPFNESRIDEFKYMEKLRKNVMDGR